MRPALTFAICALAVAGCGAAGGAAEPGELTLDQARALDGPELLFAGEEVDGLPLVAILRQSPSFSFVYGDCTPAASDQGCSPPAEVQVWPTCTRSLEQYGSGHGAPVVARTTVRGVPALSLDGGAHLELQTGRSIVVVFAGSPGRAARVAHALRPIAAEGSTGPLPPAAEDLC